MKEKEETIEEKKTQAESISPNLIEKTNLIHHNITETRHKINSPSKTDFSNEVLYFSINQDSK
jgi:hypothetical protein